MMVSSCGGAVAVVVADAPAAVAAASVAVGIQYFGFDEYGGD
jgi:hypothetical protein